MKVGLIVMFFSISTLAFSQKEAQEFERLDLKKVKADIDSIKTEMDATFYYMKATCEILKEEVKIFGLWKTIQLNSGILLPFVIFCCLYLFSLKNRN